MVCSVRVMSFNVRGAPHWGEGVNVWERRAAMNVETTRRYEPDLIGFQECQDENLEVYEKELPGYTRLTGPVYGTRQVEQTKASHGDPPTLVTGDFNCEPGTPPYRAFTEAGFVDSYLAAGHEDDERAFTFHAFKEERFTPADTDKPVGRIDWILVRDEAGTVTIRSHDILRDGDEEAGTYPSDHYPVLAVLELDD